MCLPDLQTSSEEIPQQIICRTPKIICSCKGDSGTKTHAEIRQVGTVDSSFLTELKFLSKNSPRKHRKDSFRSQHCLAPAWENTALLLLHLTSKLWSLFVCIKVKHHQQQRANRMNFNAILISRKHCLSTWIILKIISHLQALWKTEVDKPLTAETSLHLVYALEWQKHIRHECRKEVETLWASHSLPRHWHNSSDWTGRCYCLLI